jgi:LytS/YehU family sensor histidine kinase
MGLRRLLCTQLDAVEAELTLQCAQQTNAQTRAGFRRRHHTVPHVLQDVPEVLAVTVHEDASVSTHVLRVTAAKISVEKCVRHAAQRLH